MTQAWTTANVLRNNVELENHIAKGLKLELSSTLIPDKQAKNVVIASTYKQPGLNTKQHLDLLKVSKICLAFYLRQSSSNLSCC